MQKKLANITCYGEQLVLGVIGQYDNGRMAIGTETEDGERYGTLSVNLPDTPLEENEFCVKTWSENMEMADKALATGLFSDTGKRVATGFVEAPIWRLEVS